MKNNNYMLSLLNVRKTRHGYLDVEGNLHETAEQAVYNNLDVLLKGKLQYHHEMIAYIMGNINAIAPYVKGISLLNKRNIGLNEK